MVHQSAFNFADHRFGYFDAWDYHVGEDEIGADLINFIQADSKVRRRRSRMRPDYLRPA